MAAALTFGLGSGTAAASTAPLSSGSRASGSKAPAALGVATADNGFSHVRTDLDGKVLFAEGQNHIPALAIAGSQDAAAQADNASADVPALAAIVPLTATAKSFHISSSGCDFVDAWRNHYSLLGFLVWRFHQYKYWCWTYPRILTSTLSIGSRFTNVDSQQVVNWDNHGYGYYYSWAGSPYGGHFSDRNGSVSNCIFRVGCISTSYPYVDIWINGNGAFAAQWGG